MLIFVWNMQHDYLDSAEWERWDQVLGLEIIELTRQGTASFLSRTRTGVAMARPRTTTVEVQNKSQVKSTQDSSLAGCGKRVQDRHSSKVAPMVTPHSSGGTRAPKGSGFGPEFSSLTQLVDGLTQNPKSPKRDNANDHWDKMMGSDMAEVDESAWDGASGLTGVGFVRGCNVPCSN